MTRPMIGGWRCLAPESGSSRALPWRIKVRGTFACGGCPGVGGTYFAPNSGVPISGGVVRGMEMRERRIVPVGVIVGTFCEWGAVSIGSFPTIAMIGRTVQFGIVRTSRTF